MKIKKKREMERKKERGGGEKDRQMLVGLAEDQS